MQQLLSNLGRSPLYWGLLALFGLALEGGALFYQYVLDEWPCVLCIQVRIWVMAFVLLAILAMFLLRYTAVIRLLHAAVVVAMVGLLERSYQVLAVERGWVFGDCDMDLGLPPWFALDKWIPWLFEVQTSCGYTPLIVFDITMAEVLMVISVFLLLLSATLAIASWFGRA